MKVQTTGHRFTVEQITRREDAAELARWAISSGYQLELEADPYRDREEGRKAYLSATSEAWLEENVATTVMLESLVSGQTPVQILDAAKRKLKQWKIDPERPAIEAGKGEA